MYYNALYFKFDSVRFLWSDYQLHYNGVKMSDGVSNHQTHDCLLNRLFRRNSKNTPKLHVTGLCEGNSPVIGEFPPHRASNKENVSIWWRHHGSNWMAKSHFLIQCWPISVTDNNQSTSSVNIAGICNNIGQKLLYVYAIIIIRIFCSISDNYLN